MKRSAGVQPEFINRTDDIVLFNPLGSEELGKIVELELDKAMRLLAERNVRIELTPAARELLVREGYDPAYGARPLRRTVQRLVQDPLAMKILDGSVLPADLVRVDAAPDGASMQFVRVPGAAQQPASPSPPETTDISSLRRETRPRTVARVYFAQNRVR
jgi:ATP-dependent Clp protease ATP-binding subunit ClpB